MNAVEIKNMVETFAGESAETQVDDYLDGEFFNLNETDSQLETIMKDKNIKDKSGAFADVLWNNEGFLVDFLGDYVYQIDGDIVRKKLLEGLSRVVPSSHDAWHNVLAKIEKELLSA